MVSALQNCVILDGIAAYLGPADLKSCRLVCKEWNGSMTRLLGRRGCAISFQAEWYKSRKSFQIPIWAMQVDSKLLKKVKISPYRFPEKSGQRVNDVDLFLAKFQAGIEFLEFHCKDDCASEILRILNKFDFPLLAKISITEFASNQRAESDLDSEKEDDDDDDENLEYIDHLRQLPNLKTIKFHVENDLDDDDDEYDEDKDYPVQNVVQTIIRSATNLDELWIGGGNFLPILRKCKKLMKLSLTMTPFSLFGRRPPIYGMEDPEFNMDFGNTALKQVKDSLEELELNDDSSFPDYTKAHDGTFRLPKMKNLRVFRNLATDLFQVSEYMNPKYLPNLTSVSVGSVHEKKKVSIYLKNLMKTPFPAVREVSLVGVDFSIDLLSIVKVVFPNVERFTIHTTEDEHKLHLPTKSGLFGAFKNWNLKSLEIIFRQPSKFSNILLALESLPLQEIKKFTIRFGKSFASEKGVRSLTDTMCQTMMQTQNLDRLDLVGVKMGHPLVKAARDFADKNKLPMYFSSLKWCKWSA